MTCPICGDPLVSRRKDGRVGKTCGKQSCKARHRTSLMPPGHFKRIGAMARQSQRERGRRNLLHASDIRLMAAGRYYEAARQIYDRGYSAGWVACKNGRRKLPLRAA